MSAHPLHHVAPEVVSISGDGRPVGIIDIGSNSVRFVVFAGLTRAPVQLFNEKSACALGAGIQSSGVLNPDGRGCAVAAVGRYVRLARAMGVGRIDLLATAAVRDAADGPDFVAELERNFGAEVRVLSGEDEGRLASLGVLLGTPDARGVVADLGGGSLELVEIDGGEPEPVGRMCSFPLGVLRLDDIARNGDAAVDAAIMKNLEDAPWAAARQVENLYAVGGSWRALAKLCMLQENHPLQVLDKYTLPRDRALELTDLVARIGRRSMDKIPGISRRRIAALPYAARLLEILLTTIRPAHLVFSIHGMREGFYYTNLPPEIRERDPIVDMCEAVAGNGHRFAQQPSLLMRFLDPLFADEENEKQLRQRFAACMLGDLYWDEHPDFRGQQAFFKTLRLPVVGFDHEDRAALALMVLYRYQSYDEIHDAQGVLAMLSPEDRVRVQAVGCGLRLAHVITGGAPGILAGCRLIREPKRLVLRIPADDPAFDVTAFDKRLERLARCIGREAAIETV